jgi:hypothetical protein
LAMKRIAGRWFALFLGSAILLVFPPTPATAEMCLYWACLPEGLDMANLPVEDPKYCCNPGDKIFLVSWNCREDFVVAKDVWFGASNCMENVIMRKELPVCFHCSSPPDRWEYDFRNCPGKVYDNIYWPKPGEQCPPTWSVYAPPKVIYIPPPEMQPLPDSISIFEWLRRCSDACVNNYCAETKMILLPNMSVELFEPKPPTEEVCDAAAARAVDGKEALIIKLEKTGLEGYRDWMRGKKDSFWATQYLECQANCKARAPAVPKP